MKEVFPIRLKNARKIRGMSLRNLSEAMCLEVTPAALSKYEKGEMFPSSKVLIKLSTVLQMKIDDFFRPITVQLDLSQVKYRKRSSLRVKDIESINHYAALKLEKYLEVERLSGDEKCFSKNYYDITVETEDDVVAIASRFRTDLNLGITPISRPIEILENEGVKIIEVDAPHTFDGDNFTVNQVFVIVLNKNFTPERKRLSLFHEVGHKVMRFADGVNEERFCSIFANEVLIPSSVFRQAIGLIRKDISLVELKNLQSVYGISVEALMAKARQCNIISKNRYMSFCIKCNSNELFKEEVKRSVFPDERSTRYERLVYKLLAMEVISESKCASLLDCSVSEVRKQLTLV